MDYIPALLLESTWPCCGVSYIYHYTWWNQMHHSKFQTKKPNKISTDTKSIKHRDHLPCAPPTVLSDISGPIDTCVGKVPRIVTCPCMANYVSPTDSFDIRIQALPELPFLIACTWRHVWNLCNTLSTWLSAECKCELGPETLKQL